MSAFIRLLVTLYGTLVVLWVVFILFSTAWWFLGRGRNE